jgi:hypothetical protein
MVVSLIAIAVGVGWWALAPHPRITEETYQQIRSGMTLGDAEAIIGTPPGNYGGVEIEAYCRALDGRRMDGNPPPTSLASLSRDNGSTNS